MPREPKDSKYINAHFAATYANVPYNVIVEKVRKGVIRRKPYHRGPLLVRLCDVDELIRVTKQQN